MRATIKIKLLYVELSNCRLPSSVNKDLFTFQVALFIYGHHISVTVLVSARTDLIFLQ